MNIGSFGVFDTSTNLPDGSATAPSITFASDPDTGMYSAGSNQIGFTCGGLPALTFDRELLTASGNVACWNVNAETYVAAPGGSSACSFGFAGDEDTGMYLGGADTLAFSTGGVSRLTLTTGLLTSDVFLRAPAGSIGTPTYGFSADTNTGMYSAGTDIIGFTTNGTERVRISTTALAASVGIITANSSTAYTTMTATNTGSGTSIAGYRMTATSNRCAGVEWLYSDDANRGAYIGGRYNGGSALSQLCIQSSTTAYANPGSSSPGNELLQLHMDRGEWRVKDGNAALPIFSFISDTNTGIYRHSADNIGFSTGGVLRLEVGNTLISANGNVACGNLSANAITGTTISCSAQPLIVLRTSDVQTLANNTHTYLDFFGFTTTANVGGFSVFSDGNVQVPVAGSYLLNADCLFQTNTTGFRQARFVENRTTTRTASTTAASTLGGPTGVCIGAVFTLSAGDNISIQAIQTSGGDSNVNASRLSIVKLY